MSHNDLKMEKCLYEFERSQKTLILDFEANIVRLPPICTFFRFLELCMSSDLQKVSFEGETFGQKLKAGGFMGGPSMKITVIFWQKIIFRSNSEDMSKCQFEIVYIVHSS